MRKKRIKLPENVVRIVSWTFEPNGRVKCLKATLNFLRGSDAGI